MDVRVGELVGQGQVVGAVVLVWLPVVARWRVGAWLAVWSPAAVIWKDAAGVAVAVRSADGVAWAPRRREVYRCARGAVAVGASPAT
eukprot:gene7246-2808_t